MKQLLLALLSFAAPVAFAEDLAALTEQVRATEIAFAKTLADQPLRGPDQVMTHWQKFFDAPQPPFSWKPEIVEVQQGGKLALSTGPVLDPAGKRIGTYTSIWRRESTGAWKIIFDRGCPVCDCAQKKE